MDLINQIKNNPVAFSAKNTWKWFVDTIKSAGVSAVMKSSLVKTSNDFKIGDMIFYVYDPKYKKTLPYWDKFPLVFPFGKEADSFIGLNLHYLPPQKRLILMKKLIEVSSQANTIPVSWQVLKNFSKFPGADKCVKRYLFTHVRSRFIKIEKNNWATVAMLPTDNFQKRSNSYVWKQ